jgi:hypothetical protein
VTAELGLGVTHAAMPVVAPTSVETAQRQVVTSEDCIAILEEVVSKLEPFVQVAWNQLTKRQFLGQ